MSNGWRTSKLSEVCTFKPPKSEVKSRLQSNDEVSFVPMEDLPIGSKHPTLTKERRLADVESSYTYFADGDVLLAKITPCFENGKLGIADNLKNGVGFGSSEYFVLRPTNGLSSEWLYYFLTQEYIRREGASRMTGAVGHKRVPADFLENLVVPIPPLSEQKRIVAKLDDAFEAIEIAKKNTEAASLATTDVFNSELNSVFSKMFEGCAKRGLSDIAEIINGFAFKSGEFTDVKGIKTIKITNVGVGEFVETEGAYLPKSFYRTHQSVAVPAGSIVIALTRTIIAGGVKVAVVPPRYDNALLNQRVASIVVSESHLSRDFLFNYLQTRLVAEYITARVNTLMQPNLSINDLRTMPIPTPLREEQVRIALKLAAARNACSKLLDIYSRKFAALIELRRAILDDAFAGAL